MTPPNDSPPIAATRKPRAEATLQRMTAPCLTIAYHPDIRRVGEICILPDIRRDEPTKLARTVPLFRDPTFDPRVATQEGLNDEHVSESSPLLITAGADQAIRIAPTDAEASTVEIDGAPLNGPLDLSHERLEQGCVIMLGRSVVLVLHTVRLPYLPSVDTEEVGVAPSLAAIIGCNDKILDVKRKIRAVGGTPHAVLIEGPSGSGKELVARAIHDASPRRGRSFIGANMGSLVPGRAMAELMGWRRGAFPDAHRDTPGYIARANGGTLFMDEIALTPPEARAGLLRFLETFEVWPLGAEKAERADVRLVAATDTHLENAVRRGNFPLPLWERLRQFAIYVPPLCERKDDIGRLLKHFLFRYLQTGGAGPGNVPPELRYRGPDRPLWLPASFVARLLRHAWPGNIRMLENVVRHLVVISKGSDHAEVDDADIDRLLADGDAEPPKDAPVPTAPGARRPPRDISCEEIVNVLKANRWNVSATRRALGIARNSLYKRIRECPQINLSHDIKRAQLLEARARFGDDLVAMAAYLGAPAIGLKLALSALDDEEDDDAG